MLLVETAVDRIAPLLDGHRPFALVPAESRDRAQEIAAAARDHHYGFCVLQVRSRGLVVLAVAEPKHEGRLRRDARMWSAEAGVRITADEIEKVYVLAGWMTAMAHSRGADVGGTL